MDPQDIWFFIWPPEGAAALPSVPSSFEALHLLILLAADYLAKASDKNQIFKTFQARVCSVNFCPSRGLLQQTLPAFKLLLSSATFLPVLFQSFSPTELQPSQGSTMLLALLPVLGIHFLPSEYSFLVVSASLDSDCSQ